MEESQSSEHERSQLYTPVLDYTSKAAELWEVTRV